MKLVGTIRKYGSTFLGWRYMYMYVQLVQSNRLCYMCNVRHTKPVIKAFEGVEGGIKLSHSWRKVPTIGEAPRAVSGGVAGAYIVLAR